jgi:YD repeat-containing protein
MNKFFIFVAFIVLSVSTAHAQRMYDSSGRPIGRVDAERYYDASGRPLGRVDGDRIYDGSGRPLGRIDGERIFDASGRPLGRIDGDRLNINNWTHMQMTICMVNLVLAQSLLLYYDQFGLILKKEMVNPKRGNAWMVAHCVMTNFVVLNQYTLRVYPRLGRKYLWQYVH